MLAQKEQPMTPAIALVTGASRGGIGQATAQALTTAGFLVYATARRPEARAALDAQGLRSLELDVTDERSMVAAVRQIEAEHGAVDVLVNNAGFAQLGPLEELSPELLRRQFETNVFGLVRMAQLVLPAMRIRGKGRIINISSMGGEFTTPLGGAYHASKYAVESLSDALRFEVAPFGIEVVVVQPAAVKTPFADGAAAQLQADPGSPYAAMLDSLGKRSREIYEQGRGVLTPEQVAAVIVRAAQAQRPKTRYKVGATAAVMPLLRRALPDRAWDALLKQMFGLNTRQSERRATTGS
jgi:NAD(P)-dependent dehydrogenase (short-subunit alcohol dehydrogenase family)